MEPAFWHKRWEDNQIGFHQAVVNKQLAHYASKFTALNATPRVLVPLCGKSGDMAYLRSLGYEVVGVELSRIAIEAYFAEHKQSPSLTELDRGVVCYEADGVAILCGDMFAVTPEILGPVHAAYDRAALVALPPDMRKRYAKHLASLLPPGAPMLLLTCDYPQAEMSGPPFAVPSAEVTELLKDHFDIAMVEDEDISQNSGGDGRPTFKVRVSWAREQTYLLTRCVG